MSSLTRALRTSLETCTWTKKQISGASLVSPKTDSMHSSGQATSFSTSFHSSLPVKRKVGRGLFRAAPPLPRRVPRYTLIFGTSSSGRKLFSGRSSWRSVRTRKPEKRAGFEARARSTSSKTVMSWNSFIVRLHAMNLFTCQ